MRTDLPLDALDMALWKRDVVEGALIHHSDRGSQYTSLRYTERLADAGALPSVGSVADAYDNAMAEALMATFKRELIHRQTWRDRDHLELEVARWVGWYNTTRLHESLGDVPPAEFEAAWRTSHPTSEVADAVA